MEQRLTLVTLGVEDMVRSRAFYETGLGWTPGRAEETVVFYPLVGMVLGLYPRAALAEDAGVDPEGTGFRGVTLAYNVRERDDVSRVLEEAVQAGGTLVKPAEDAFWGGHSGYFADPDGHLWEVAWNPFWTIRPDGSVTLDRPESAGPVDDTGS